MAFINSIYASYDPISCGYVSHKRDSNGCADIDKSLCLFTSLAHQHFTLSLCRFCVDGLPLGWGRYGRRLLEGVEGGGGIPPRKDYHGEGVAEKVAAGRAALPAYIIHSPFSFRVLLQAILRYRLFSCPRGVAEKRGHGLSIAILKIL